jgi:hypothetical protein
LTGSKAINVGAMPERLSQQRRLPSHSEDVHGAAPATTATDSFELRQAAQAIVD